MWYVILFVVGLAVGALLASGLFTRLIARFFPVILAALILHAAPALAQGPPPHAATLKWIASADAGSNPTLFYNVYRATGPCPASGSPTTLVRIGSSLAAVLTYRDDNVQTAQAYCYVVRSPLNGVESIDSNTSGVVIPLAPATGLTVTSP